MKKLYLIFICLVSLNADVQNKEYGNTIAELKRMLPIFINPSVAIVDANIKDDVIHYKFNILNRDKFLEKERIEIINSMCSDELTKFLLKNNVTLSLEYYNVKNMINDDGVLFQKILINNKSCNIEKIE